MVYGANPRPAAMAGVLRFFCPVESGRKMKSLVRNAAAPVWVPWAVAAAMAATGLFATPIPAWGWTVLRGFLQF